MTISADLSAGQRDRDSPSEGEWVRRARQGDGNAWLQIVRTHQETVYRLAYLIVGDAADAEEVAQDAFLRAHDALPRFDTARPLRPWLLQITRNLARNKRRSIGRYLAAVRRWREQAPLATRDASRDDAQLLRQATSRLPRTAQEVIYLRYFLEMSEAETADTLGIPRGTVKSRLSRALVKLRDVVDREYPQLRVAADER